MTAFTHVSSDGKRLCVPMTDGRCLDYDPKTEGEGLDRRPVYNIDRRVQDENLSSYLCVYDTESGGLLYEKQVPKCWITHVQFDSVNPDIILYNHEWACFDCGIRRMWLYDRARDEIRRVRTEGADTLGDPRGFARKRGDWVCHEMWSEDGRYIIYHGGYENGPAMVGRYDLSCGQYHEIALPDDYKSYGHFTMDAEGNLVCDGYYRHPGDVVIERENSTDNGPTRTRRTACTSLLSDRTGRRGSSPGRRSAGMTATGSDRTRTRTRSSAMMAVRCISTAGPGGMERCMRSGLLKISKFAIGIL